RGARRRAASPSPRPSVQPPRTVGPMGPTADPDPRTLPAQLRAATNAVADIDRARHRLLGSARLCRALRCRRQRVLRRAGDDTGGLVDERPVVGPALDGHVPTGVLVARSG